MSIAGSVPRRGIAKVSAVDGQPIVTLRVRDIRGRYAIRQSGIDERHLASLAETADRFAPIIVHESTMLVIDGAHRLEVTRRLGSERIAARIFSGTDTQAFMLALAFNARHGLPLSLVERKAAAELLIRRSPEISDRAIAHVAGLSHTTVGRVRRQLSGNLCPRVRLGLDGRSRPTSTTNRKEAASEFIATNPSASLRTIAGRAGISIGTAKTVKDQIRDGEAKRQIALSEPSPVNTVGSHVDGRVLNVLRSGEPDQLGSNQDRLAGLIQRLRRDPSVRYAQRGREAVKWLEQHGVTNAQCVAIAAALPPHCRSIVQELAGAYAASWRILAEQVEA